MLLRILFAVVLGVLGYGLMQWLTSAPHGVDVAVGVVVAILAYWQYPGGRALA